MSDEMTTVTGLRVKKFVSTEGKKEEDPGRIQITLEADKDSIRVSGEDVGEYDLGDIVGALNMHQTATEPVVVVLRFPDK
jgi:hypothetical protein